MYEPLHHKYRPQTFAQLVGQGAIAATLIHALQQNRIAPAYLFCGPRGTGKTSSARILAKSLNCLKVDAPTAEPCGECDVCQSVNRGSALDIVEIDAASNTGVDNIRELIERAQFAPVQCRYKLFVLDEVHMLSTAAFNALLKTLEEPPDRVVFVLATTDPQRVLPTIISRCQRFDFRRIPLPSMIKHLSYIAAEETINIAEPAVQLVAQISQGGLRDAESLLDQLSLQADEITVETVWDLVGAVPERDLLNLVHAITADDSTALLERVRHLMDKGREPLIVLQSLVGFYRDLLIAKRAPTREDLVAITPPTWQEMTEFSQRLSAPQLLASQQKLQLAEVQVKNTTQPRLWLEITLTGLLPSAMNAAGELAASSTPNIKRSAPPIAPPPIAPPSISTPAPAQKVSPPTPSHSSQTDSDQKSSGQKASTQPAPAVSPPAPTRIDAPAASPAVSPSETGADDASPSEKFAASDGPSESATSDPPIPPPIDDEPAAPEVAFGSLADLWNQLLSVLQPRGTQMLMSQQGMLLGFDGVGAKVGFRSASLQKMARERVPNLEAAFEAIFHRPIKVSLEVVSVEEAPPPPTSEPPPPPPVQRNPSPPAPQNSNSGRAANANGSNANGFKADSNGRASGDSGNNGSSKDNLANQGNRDAFGGHPASYSQPSPPLPAERDASRNTPRNPPRNPRLDAPTGPRAMDQDQEKIKRFANFFNGQIVNLDDDAEDPVDNSSNDGSSRTQSPDPGPDVPF
ncbi:MAG: DNA polymerase III subunit gamma/tau [Cyanobacteria bacterium J06649_4]